MTSLSTLLICGFCGCAHWPAALERPRTPLPSPSCCTSVLHNTDGVLVRLINLTQTRVTWGEGTEIEEVPPSACPAGMSVEHFLDY